MVEGQAEKVTSPKKRPTKTFCGQVADVCVEPVEKVKTLIKYGHFRLTSPRFRGSGLGI
jgi:hypothetical protein